MNRDARVSDGMDCRELRERHGEWLDGLVTPLLAARIHAHLVDCSACARYDRIVRRGVELVRETTDIAPSDEFALRLQHRLTLVDEGDLGVPRSATGFGMTVAVAGVIALLAWSPLLLPSRSGETVADAADAATTGEGTWFVPLRPADVRIGANVVPAATLDPWFPTEPATLLQMPARAAVFPGPHSPLIVNPPVHGTTVRTISTEYRRVD